MEMAEKLVPKVRAAEWRDRAEAAQRDLEVIDLRDLRSVVSTADAAAKDDETRALAQQLREGLSTRAEAEQKAWLAELTATVEVGRIVRALRLSSRPPKAGSPLPAELATKLTEGAGAALTEDAAPERWVAVLDALAFAPVRDKVIPASLPKDLHPDVRATIARLATRIPKIAHIFEIEPDRNAPRPKIERRRPPKKQPPKAKSDKPKRDKPPRTPSPPSPRRRQPSPRPPPRRTSPPRPPPRARSRAPPSRARPRPGDGRADADCGAASSAPKEAKADEQPPSPARSPWRRRSRARPLRRSRHRRRAAEEPRPVAAEEPEPSGRPGEAAGGAGVSPAEPPEGGSADPEAQREPEASTDERLARGRRAQPAELERPTAVLARRRVLVPAGAAGRAGARVEPQRGEVEALHLVRLTERTLEVPGSLLHVLTVTHVAAVREGNATWLTCPPCLSTTRSVGRSRSSRSTVPRPATPSTAPWPNGIEDAIDQIEADDAIWVGILTGEPPVFCAGADLKEINSGNAGRLATARGGFAGFVQRERTKPIIAAVDGPALAGGTEIVLAVRPRGGLDHGHVRHPRGEALPRRRRRRPVPPRPQDPAQHRHGAHAHGRSDRRRPAPTTSGS